MESVPVFFSFAWRRPDRFRPRRAGRHHSAILPQVMVEGRIAHRMSSLPPTRRPSRATPGNFCLRERTTPSRTGAQRDAHGLTNAPRPAAFRRLSYPVLHCLDLQRRVLNLPHETTAAVLLFAWCSGRLGNRTGHRLHPLVAPSVDLGAALRTASRIFLKCWCSPPRFLRADRACGLVGLAAAQKHPGPWVFFFLRVEARQGSSAARSRRGAPCRVIVAGSSSPTPVWFYR